MPEFYTTQEVADILKITEKKVRNYISQGRITAISLTGTDGNKRGPRALRISNEDLNRFIEENKIS